MKDGIIELDSPMGRKLGFTSDKFNGYLWKNGREIIISIIMSKYPGKGNFSSLLNNIAKMGFDIAIPTSSPHIKEILKRKGFRLELRNDPEFGWVEVCLKK